MVESLRPSDLRARIHRFLVGGVELRRQANVAVGAEASPGPLSSVLL